MRNQKIAALPMSVYTLPTGKATRNSLEGRQQHVAEPPSGQMLDHLISADLDPTVFSDVPDSFVPMAKATPAQTIDAQVTTADWLKDLGLDDDKAQTEAETQTARAAFATLTTGSTPASVQLALTNIKAPAAVRHLVGMLTAYDWEFVHQAKELRGYAVAKLVEECESPNANIRLKALGLLGKVTEIGLFTDKIEVKKTDMTEAEIDQRLKEKLAKFMDVSDADVTDITEITTITPTNDKQPTVDA